MSSDALEPGVTPPGATSAGAFADSTLQHHVSAAAKLEHVAALVDVVGERGLHPKQAGLDRGSAPEAPKQAGEPENQLALDGGLSIKIRGDGQLERLCSPRRLRDRPGRFRRSGRDGAHSIASVVCRVRIEVLYSGGRCGGWLRFA